MYVLLCKVSIMIENQVIQMSSIFISTTITFLMSHKINDLKNKKIKTVQ